jgi:hypothetical protein
MTERRPSVTEDLQHVPGFKVAERKRKLCQSCGSAPSDQDRLRIFMPERHTNAPIHIGAVVCVSLDNAQPL